MKETVRVFAENIRDALLSVSFEKYYKEIGNSRHVFQPGIS